MNVNQLRKAIKVAKAESKVIILGINTIQKWLDL